MIMLCLYSIVRYVFYVEMEEFVNIGVVLCVFKNYVFYFKLMKSNDVCVSVFFCDDIIFCFVRDVVVCEFKFV